MDNRYNKYKKFRKFTKKEVEDIKRKNKNIIEKVKLWQAFKYVKPLVCKKEGCGGILDPKESRLKVILKCPKCGFTQTYVPRTILKTKLATPKVMIEHQNKMHSA